MPFSSSMLIVISTGFGTLVGSVDEGGVPGGGAPNVWAAAGRETGDGDAWPWKGIGERPGGLSYLMRSGSGWML